MDTVLYVDDEDINLQLFKINFGKLRNILLARSGKEGLQMIEDHPEISVVFSDMKMPFINGIEFIRQAKTVRPNIACYLITGYGLTDEIQAAIEAGIIVKYLKKPFILSELLDAMACSNK